MNAQSVSGKLVLPDGVVQGRVDFDPASGLISAVEPGKKEENSYEDSCLIFPGFVDIHVHAREDASQKLSHKECFATAAKAALHGGVTCAADMPNTRLPASDPESCSSKARLASGHGVHFALYAAVKPGSTPLPFPAPYKVFLGPSTGDLFFEDFMALDRTLAGYAGQAVSFHCEDASVLEGCKGKKNHEDRRPPEAEVAAVAQAIALIKRHGLKGTICHLSTKEALNMFGNARKKGMDICCEAAPHHLFFDKSMLTDANRKLLQMNPPLRSTDDRQALIEALREGEIDFLASDHAPHTLPDKLSGASGVPQLDTYGAFVAWLIKKQDFTPQQVLACACTRPARFLAPFLPKAFGKGVGRLEAGYRADLTVLNLEKPWAPKNGEMLSRCGWTPFAGIELPGRVEAVYAGGRLMTQKQDK